MQYDVTQNFFDKITGTYHPIGSTYETKDKTRAEELKDGGYITGDEKPTARRTSPEPKPDAIEKE